MQLQLDPRFAALLTPGCFHPHTVHNLPVVDREGGAKEAGIALLLNLHRRRWREADLGPSLVPDRLVMEAARWSSGIVREFLTLVTDTGKAALREGRAEAIDADLKLAVRERRHTMEITVDAGSLAVLGEVYRTQHRPETAADELLLGNAIVCYQNESVWYYPNQLLVPYVVSSLEGRREA
ncbi:MAG: hypothetical protein ABIO70_32235 [Pseudomonadota bacterium]